MVKSAGAALSSVFTAGLALTTSLLMFIWFSNALTYYGEVLLTTTVRLRTPQHARSYLFSVETRTLLGSLSRQADGQGRCVIACRVLWPLRL